MIIIINKDLNLRINHFVNRLFLTAFIALMVSLKAFGFSGITEREVSIYLTEKGYDVESVKLIPDCEDWISDNSDNSNTRVYVVGGQIVGHEDVNW